MSAGTEVRSMFPDGHPIWSQGYIATRRIATEPGKWLTVVPLTFGRARLCVADGFSISYEHWCFDSPAQALLYWTLYPTPPMGWNRHQKRNGHFEWSDGRTDEDD